jgi:hypothetical protein
MADKYYAWGEIRTGKKVIPRGTVVTEKDIGDDWDALIKCGSISTKVFPKMPDTWQGSVRSFRNEQIRALKAGLDAKSLLALDITDDDEGDPEYRQLLAQVEDTASE